MFLSINFSFSILLFTSFVISGLLAQNNISDVKTDYSGDDYYDYYEDYVEFPEGAFECADGSKNISITETCKGDPDCPDESDEFASLCDNCNADDLFRCQGRHEQVCLHQKFQCDGLIHCQDTTDELFSECGGGNLHDDDTNALARETGGCGDPDKFQCRFQGQITCLSRERYQCNGIIECDDWKDEMPSACNDCERDGLFKCRDGSQCVKKENVCDKKPHCADGSDESDSFAGCDFCKQDGTVPCPGFEDICATLCDGAVQCPDHWDELLATCEVFSGHQNCNKEVGLYSCRDGSKCIRKENFCDNFKDCKDGEDESSTHCKDKCSDLIKNNFALLECDGSCIRKEQACGAHDRPLCKDGADMDPSLCRGKCFYEFPGRQDPYRSPCRSEGKCILKTSIHDGNVDCARATDEEGRPWYADLNFAYTVLLSLAVVIIAWTFYQLISTFPIELNQSFDLSSTSSAGKTPPIPLEEITPGKSLDVESETPTEPKVPSFLDHPALRDIDNTNTTKESWKDIGEELRIEDIFFNEDPQSLVALLSHIESQDAHPQSLQKVVDGFLHHLDKKGFSEDDVAIQLKKTIGHHRLSALVLSKPPNAVVVKIYEARKSAEEFESKGGNFSFIMPILRTIVTSIFPFFFFLDYVKDLVVYPLVRDTVKRLDEGCKNVSALGFSCLATSGVEKHLLNALLVAIILSIIATSLFAFFNRKVFFKTNRLLDALFFICAPLLPAIYHIHVSLRQHRLDKKKKVISNTRYQEEMQIIDSQRDIIFKAKSIEIGLEAIVQLFLLFGFGTFVSFTFEAPSGQSYSYFYSVAKLVLRGNSGIVFFSIIVSFVVPTIFATRATNHFRHNSLSIVCKMAMTAQNVFLFAARLGAFLLAVFIPAISRWSVFSRNAGYDASSHLDYSTLGFEFDKYFGNALKEVSAEVQTRSFIFLFCVALHLIAVYIYALSRSPKFKTSKIVDRLLHLISSFWLPIPFLTLEGLDRGEEEPELWFLLALHSVENFGLLLSSLVVHFEGDFASGLLAMQIIVLCFNMVGVLLALGYNKRIQLYAGLTQDSLSAPDGQPKVVQFNLNEIVFIYKYI